MVSLCLCRLLCFGVNRNIDKPAKAGLFTFPGILGGLVVFGCVSEQGPGYIGCCTE